MGEWLCIYIYLLFLFYRVRKRVIKLGSGKWEWECFCVYSKWVRFKKGKWVCAAFKNLPKINNHVLSCDSKLRGVGCGGDLKGGVPPNKRVDIKNL